MAQKQDGFYYTYSSPNGLEFVLVKGPSEEPVWALNDRGIEPMLFETEEKFYTYVDQFQAEFACMIGLETNLVPTYYCVS